MAKLDSRGMRYEGFIAWPLYGPEYHGTWGDVFKRKAIVFDDPNEAKEHAFRAYTQTTAFVLANVYYYENHVIHKFDEAIWQVSRTYTNRYHTQYDTFYRQTE